MISIIKRLLVIAPLLASPAVNAAEFEVVDKFSANNYSQFRGSVAVVTDDLSSSGILWVSTYGATTPNLYVSTTGNVGIGTVGPLGNLHVSGTDSSIWLDSYDPSGSPTPGITFRAARGTVGAPSATQLNDTIGALGTRAYGATGFSSLSKANIYLGAGETWTDTAQGTFISFTTTANGGTTKTEKVRIASNGNVGIGTAAPAAKLTINDDLAVNTGAPSLHIIQPYANTDSGADYAIGLEIDKFKYLIADGVTANGYQRGIAAFMHVNDSNFAGTIANQTAIFATTGIYAAAVSGARTITNAYGLYIDNMGAAVGSIGNEYGIYQSGSQAKNYFGGGVGIGTTLPLAKAHVNSALWLGNAEYHLTLAGYGADDANTDGDSFIGHNAYYSSGNRGTNLKFKAITSHGAFGARAITMGYGYGILFHTLPQATAVTAGIEYALTERMIITNDGNVGIGTTAPGSPFVVYGNSSGEIRQAIANAGTGAAVLYLDAANGDLAGSDYSWIRQNNNLTLELGTDTSAGNIYLMPKGGSGNVGIGTTDPVAKLDVNGTLSVTGAYTGSGIIVSAASGVPQTLFTASGVGSRYSVTAVLNSVNVSQYGAFADVLCDGETCRIVANNGTILTLTLSGNAVQATQSSGGSINIYYRYFRMGS